MSPLLAEFFMANLENTAVRPIIQRFHLYKRYMDDISIICEKNVDHYEILNQFNICRHSIQCKSETEANEEYHVFMSR